MPIWYRRLANPPEKSAVPDGYDFPVSFGERRPGDIVVSVAAANRIRELLDWTPELDDLDAIVGHALAWERRLMVQAGSEVRKAISA